MSDLADTLLQRFDTERTMSIEVPAFGSAGGSAVDAAMRLKDGMPLMPIDVPEFGNDGDGNPVRVWMRPFTLREAINIDANAEGSDAQRLVYTLLFKLLDADGERIFAVGHKSRLMKMEPDIVAGIVIRMREACTIEAIAPDMDDSDPFIASFRPVTMRDMDAVRRLGEGDQHRSMAAELIVKMLGDDGKPIFAAKHLDLLLDIPDSIIADIMLRMHAESDRRSYDDTVKP